MIYGVGVDIIKISRIEDLYNKFGKKFLNKIYTRNEQEIGEVNISYYAKRFAAKEAVVKAFGTGIGKVIGFLDIEILNNENGKPFVKISNKAEVRIKQIIDNYSVFLSIADEKEYATAFAVIENVKNGD